MTLTSTAEPASQPSLRERRRAETRTAIVDAARELFAEQGYDEARVADVARRAGVSDATLFRYFRAKSSLALVGVEERIRFAIEHLEDQPGDRSGIDAAKGVVAQVRDLSLFGPEDPVLVEIAMVAGSAELLTALEALITSAAAELSRALARRAGRDRPELSDVVEARVIAAV
ncbi:MAG: helix-turn-helix domain-containing protein, partial [Actinomycetota bacterium]